jgi:phosphinothricin acetyltransferase
MIRSATTDDAARICEIYNHYILHSTITFEEQVISVEEMQQRIEEVVAGLPWLVWVDDQLVQGFAYASKWKGRCAYRYSVESTVYLAEGSTGKGIGSKLYEALLTELRNNNMHVVMGGIALPNDASVALHEKLGFEKVAHFREVGWKFGKWIDVGYWQLFL